MSTSLNSCETKGVATVRWTFVTAAMLVFPFTAVWTVLPKIWFVRNAVESFIMTALWIS